MNRHRNCVPLLAILTISLNIAPISAQESTSVSQTPNTVEIISTQEAAPSQAETQIAELQSVDSGTPIEGKIEKDTKKKYLFGKIGAFIADVLLFGDYPDGYTSFVSY